MSLKVDDVYFIVCFILAQICDRRRRLSMIIDHGLVNARSELSLKHG